jgi:hypothetical protein
VITLKFDPKTGQKKPENRSDELRISLGKLKELSEKYDGVMDKKLEMYWIMQDINISLGLTVDLLGAIYNKICNGVGINVNREADNGEEKYD